MSQPNGKRRKGSRRRGKHQCPRPDKVAYHNKSWALRALTNPHYRDRHFDYEPTRIYLCQCGKWHLTSQDEK